MNKRWSFFISACLVILFFGVIFGMRPSFFPTSIRFLPEKAIPDTFSHAVLPAQASLAKWTTWTPPSGKDSNLRHRLPLFVKGRSFTLLLTRPIHNRPTLQVWKKIVAPLPGSSRLLPESVSVSVVPHPKKRNYLLIHAKGNGRLQAWHRWTLQYQRLLNRQNTALSPVLFHIETSQADYMVYKNTWFIALSPPSSSQK